MGVAAAGRVFAAIVLAVAAPLHAAADTLFHISEVMVEQEVRPRVAEHRSRWLWDYYVGDSTVTVSGWKTPGRPVPFDVTREVTGPTGLRYSAVFHRLQNGIDLVMEFDSFILERRIVQDGPQSCRVSTIATLKPGHDLFEKRRISNHEPIYLSTVTYTALSCTLPKLIG